VQVLEVLRLVSARCEPKPGSDGLVALIMPTGRSHTRGLRSARAPRFGTFLTSSRFGSRHELHLGQNVVVSPRVKVGNNVNSKQRVAITGVELGRRRVLWTVDGVTNVVNPRSHVVPMSEYRRTLGQTWYFHRCQCNCGGGVTLGSTDFVGACGLDSDVPDYALMVASGESNRVDVLYCGIRPAARGWGGPVCWPVPQNT